MDGLDQFVEALKKLPLRRRQGLLARCVSRAALEGTSPPDFLYASTRAGRYNPKNVESIYWSQGDTVAQLEFRRYHKGAQAYETFFCRFNLTVQKQHSRSLLHPSRDRPWHAYPEMAVMFGQNKTSVRIQRRNTEVSTTTDPSPCIPMIRKSQHLQAEGQKQSEARNLSLCRQVSLLTTLARGLS